MCFAKVGCDAPRADELWDIKRGNLIPAEALNSIRVDVNANSNLHNYKVSYGGSGISSDSPPPRNSASAYRPSSSGYGASSLI
jgi:hypothetical protein